MTAGLPHLTILIPTLDAAATLGPCLAAIAAQAGQLDCDVLVVDGGSADATADVAITGGARVLASPPGRGQQLRAGAAAAAGDWLLFLHADSLLPAGWSAAVTAFMADPANAQRAGYGRLRFDDESGWARLIEQGAALRSRWLALPYGDQGLLLSRALYESAGGYPDWPLMEDVGLARQLGRRRLVALDMVVTTSAARYRRDGWLRRPLRNLCCLALFFAGVSPARIQRLYER